MRTDQQAIAQTLRAIRQMNRRTMAAGFARVILARIVNWNVREKILLLIVPGQQIHAGVK